MEEEILDVEIERKNPNEFNSISLTEKGKMLAKEKKKVVETKEDSNVPLYVVHDCDDIWDAKIEEPLHAP